MIGKRLIPIALLLSVLFSIMPFQAVLAVTESNNLYVAVIGKNVIFYSESVNIQIRSNISPNATVNFSDNEFFLVYSQNHPVNSSFSYIPPESYGKNTIQAVIGLFQSETWFWLQDIRNLSSISLPYSWVFENIRYVLLVNYTLQIQYGGTSLNIDWLSESESKLNQFTTTVYKNDFGLIYIPSIGKDAKNGQTDSWIMNTCFGVKLRINGTIEKVTTLKWNYKAFNGIIAWSLDTIRIKTSSGNLIYDYSDLSTRSLGCIYTLDKTLQKMDITLQKEFDIDPYIFSDGFESGNFASWTGQSSGNGGSAPTVQTTNVHHGTYNMNATISNAAASYSS